MFRERRASPSLPAARFFDERRVLLAECIQSRLNEWVGEDTACASFAGTSRPRAVSIISIGSILGAPGLLSPTLPAVMPEVAHQISAADRPDGLRRAGRWPGSSNRDSPPPTRGGRSDRRR